MPALAGCDAGNPRSCTVSCSAEGECPSGTSCGTDGYCYAEGETAGSCMFAGTPDGSTILPPDASFVEEPDGSIVIPPDAAVERPDAGTDPRPDACDGPLTFADEDVGPFTIPDADVLGISRSIVATNAGCVVVESVQVRIDITHTFRGDLTILLTAPDGQSVVVLPPSNDSTDDVHETFNVDIARGDNAAGEWLLTVIDDAEQDFGTLDRWSLGINRLAP